MKALWLVPAIAGIVVIARRCGLEMGGLCTRMFETMPDNCPPKQMHQNILTIREQTERILGILEKKARSGS